MKQTALTELINYYKRTQNTMPYDIFCHRLADKIMELQGLEREQIIKAYNQRAIDQFEGSLRTGTDYYEQNYI
jgi:hypothetical protein